MPHVSIQVSLYMPVNMSTQIHICRHEHTHMSVHRSRTCPGHIRLGAPYKHVHTNMSHVQAYQPSPLESTIVGWAAVKTIIPKKQSFSNPSYLQNNL